MVIGPNAAASSIRDTAQRGGEAVGGGGGQPPDRIAGQTGRGVAADVGGATKSRPRLATIGPTPVGGAAGSSTSVFGRAHSITDSGRNCAGGTSRPRLASWLPLGFAPRPCACGMSCAAAWRPHRRRGRPCFCRDRAGPVPGSAPTASLRSSEPPSCRRRQRVRAARRTWSRRLQARGSDWKGCASRVCQAAGAACGIATPWKSHDATPSTIADNRNRCVGRRADLGRCRLTPRTGPCLPCYPSAIGQSGLTMINSAKRSRQQFQAPRPSARHVAQLAVAKMPVAKGFPWPCRAKRTSGSCRWRSSAGCRRSRSAAP